MYGELQSSDCARIAKHDYHQETINFTRASGYRRSQGGTLPHISYQSMEAPFKEPNTVLPG
jgi:hypothetical protein